MTDLKLIKIEEKPIVTKEGSFTDNKAITFICEANKEQQLAITRLSNNNELLVHLKS